MNKREERQTYISLNVQKGIQTVKLTYDNRDIGDERQTYLSLNVPKDK